MLTTSLQNRVWVQRVARAAGEGWSHSMLVGVPCCVWSWSDPVSGMGVGHSVPKVMAGTEIEVLTLCPWSQSPGTLQPLRPYPRPFSGSQNYHQETKRFMDALVTWCHLWGGEKKVKTELQRLKWVAWFFWGGRGDEGRGEPWVVWYCYTYWIISKVAFPQIWLVLIWHCKE